MKKALVVGSGAGGSTIARELQAQGKYQVTILEAGKEFKPLSWNLKRLAALRKTGLFLDERMIQVLFPHMRIRKMSDKLVVVAGKGTGGTTTLATGNALRYDQDLLALGIDLGEEFEALELELPITVEHRKHWSALTEELYSACKTRGFDPQPLPKFLHAEKCVRCGQCVLGCQHGAKWDACDLLRQAVRAGAELKTGHQVRRLLMENGQATGVEVAGVGSLSADVVIVAAGGLDTPVILQNSGIQCESKLFVDPVLCVAAPYEGAVLDRQLPMPFVVQGDRYIISPYFDHLSFFFNNDWKRPSQNIMSLMIKLADVPQGEVTSGGINKELVPLDKERLDQAVQDCQAILGEVGIAEKDMFLGTLNAGHPGGMLPLTPAEAKTLHNPRLPENVYVADATLFPNSLGNPPILTIMALAKRIAHHICTT